MEVIPHINSVYANSWMGWVMFVLLVLILLDSSKQYNLLMGVRSVVSQAERAYTVHSRAWGSEIGVRLFRLGVVSMAVWILTIANNPSPIANSLSPIANSQSPIAYAKILALVGGVYALQRLLLRGVGQVFVSSKQRIAAIEQYNGICTMACVSLYPILLVLMNVTTPNLAQILCGIVLVLFIGLVVWKSIRLFYVNILSILYILIYIIYLEIIPIVVIISLAKNI